jgi:hypothetical protein
MSCVLFIAALVVGMALAYAKARSKRKAAGESTNPLDVMHQINDDSERRRIDRADLKSERKQARYRARHPRKFAKIEAKQARRDDTQS